MNKKLLNTLTITVLAVLFGFGAVHAQTLGAYTAEIPFDFSVGDELYTAGDYVIKVKSPNYLADLMVLRTAEGRTLETFALARNGVRSKDENARLIFYRDGDDYFLKQIVAPRFGFTAPESKFKGTVRYKPGPEVKKNTVSILLKRDESRSNSVRVSKASGARGF